MHKIYKLIWESALKIENKCPISKRVCYLLLTTMLWCAAGAVLYGVVIAISPCRFSLMYFLASIGYFGIIMGFGGGSMYILRNTEPEDFI